MDISYLSLLQVPAFDDGERQLFGSDAIAAFLGKLTVVSCTFTFLVLSVTHLQLSMCTGISSYANYGFAAQIFAVFFLFFLKCVNECLKQSCLFAVPWSSSVAPVGRVFPSSQCARIRPPFRLRCRSRWSRCCRVQGRAVRSARAS